MKRKGNRLLILFVCIALLAIVSGSLAGYQYYKQKKQAESQKKVVSTNKIAEVKKEEEIKDKKESTEISSNTPQKIETAVAESNVVLKHNDKGIPVLMYHSIAYEKGNDVRLPKEKFKEQMKYLKENGYTTLTLNQAYDFFISDKPVPEKSIVLTFDDGYVDNYVDAFPILKEYGLKATIFVITDYVDKSSAYLSLEQLKELQNYGIDIESHTVNHEYLNKISYDEQIKTLRGAREFLEKALNKKIQYIAYPYGKYTKDTLKAAKESGYTMAFTTDGKWSDKTDGILTLDRVYISGSAGIEVFKERISNPDYKTM